MLCGKEVICMDVGGLKGNKLIEGAGERHRVFFTKKMDKVFLRVICSGIFFISDRYLKNMFEHRKHLLVPFPFVRGVLQVGCRGSSFYYDLINSSFL